MPSPPSSIHVLAAPPYAPPYTSSSTAPGSLRPASPLALFHRDTQRLFAASSAPQLVPAPSFPTSPSREPPSNLRRDPSKTSRALISRGTQTDPISIRVEMLVRLIMRGLVSLAAMQFLAIYDMLFHLCSGSPASRALFRLYIAYFIRPVLRGVHFSLIWIRVFIHILSAVIALLTLDPIL